MDLMDPEQRSESGSLLTGHGVHGTASPPSPGCQQAADPAEPRLA